MPLGEAGFLIFQRIGFLLTFFFVLWVYRVFSAISNTVPSQLIVLILFKICMIVGILVDICGIV